MSKKCQYQNCTRGCYGEFCIQHKPRKRLRQQSDKEREYQVWKEEVARPAVIERDGTGCSCSGGCSKLGTDLDHKKNKGSHPSLKRDIKNLQLLCRYPCHDNKTNNRECIHAEN